MPASARQQPATTRIKNRLPVPAGGTCVYHITIITSRDTVVLARTMEHTNMDMDMGDTSMGHNMDMDKDMGMDSGTESGMGDMVMDMGNHSMPHTDMDMDMGMDMGETSPAGSNMMDMPESPFCGGMGMGHHDMTGMNMGGGMTMYMDGFRSTFASDSDTPCLNLFFPAWTLDTRGKFVAAMLGVLFLAICVEGISALRLYAHKSMTPGRKRKMLIMGMHGSQALFGYVLMMATMTFSIEMLLSVCTGLGAGYGVFFDDSTTSHVTTNPCCGFMADEALETQDSAGETSTESSEKRHPSSCCDDDDDDDYNAQTAVPAGTA
eukprot:scaffold62569_cov69-Attheya_sp.AAC.1